MGLEYFSFSDLWSPVALVFTMAVGVLYTFVVGPWRMHFKDSALVPLKKQIVFLIALALLYLAQAGPLSLLGHLMFSFHMLVMAISYFIVPPMFLYSIPGWFWKWLFDRKFLRPLRPLTHPLIGLFMLNLLFSIYHIPSIHDWIMVHTTFHAWFYFILFVTAMLNWWHIHCPVPEWSRVKPLARIAYIFGNGLLLTPACVMIIFAGSPLFKIYNDPYVWAQAMQYCVSGDPQQLLAQFQNGAQFFSLLSPRDDQQLGGILMKFLQEFMNIWALAVVFIHWYRHDRKKEDTPEWDDAARVV
jgi:putative membrane protein